MEFDLRGTEWPECVIRCNDALARLQPGKDVVFIVEGADVLSNILLLVKSKPNCTYVQSQCADFYQIHVMHAQPTGGGAAPR